MRIYISINTLPELFFITAQRTGILIIYRNRKDERLSWPEQLPLNKLLKVITRRLSGTAGFEPATDPETDTLTIQPLRLLE